MTSSAVFAQDRWVGTSQDWGRSALRRTSGTFGGPTLQIGTSLRERPSKELAWHILCGSQARALSASSPLRPMACRRASTHRSTANRALPPFRALARGGVNQPPLRLTRWRNRIWAGHAKRMAHRALRYLDRPVRRPWRLRMRPQALLCRWTHGGMLSLTRTTSHQRRRRASPTCPLSGRWPSLKRSRLLHEFLP